MKFCSKCGKELADDAVFCSFCGSVANPEMKNTVPQKEDKVSVGLCVLAYFIPLFGLIYWAITRTETPKKAKAVGITALVSWIVNIVVSIIASVAWTGFITSLLL